MGDYNVLTVAFGEEFVEVSYSEPERQGPNVQKVQSLLVLQQAYPDAIAEIEDMVCDLINTAEAEYRNPSKPFRVQEHAADE